MVLQAPRTRVPCVQTQAATGPGPMGIVHDRSILIRETALMPMAVKFVGRLYN